MSKTFTQAPKPQPLADNVIAAFERGGSGQDTRAHISTKEGRRETTDVGTGDPPEVGSSEPTKVGKRQATRVGKREATKEAKPERTRRLSIDLPESLHRRFKTACSRTDKKMLAEVTEFIKRRTLQLEKE